MKKEILSAEEIASLQNETGDEMVEHVRLTVDKGQTPTRIDKFLCAYLGNNISRTKIQNAADTGSILVNNSPVKCSYKIQPGDEILLIIPKPEENYELVPDDIPLDIIYEDDHLIVLNKAPEMVVHPGLGNFRGTLANAVLGHLKDKLPPGEVFRPGLVHRLDKGTSGLMVVAKTEMALNHLARQFFKRTTKRKYIALVWGDVPDEQGTIAVNIGRDSKERMQMEVYPEGDKGKHAVTHYKVLERLHYVTLIECSLETGRTHQIRVHMKYIGHTLFNDARYGGNKILKGTVYTKYRQFVENCFQILPRQALHAATLGFIHPHTGEELFFEQPLPENFLQVLAKWRKYWTNPNADSPDEYQ